MFGSAATVTTLDFPSKSVDKKNALEEPTNDDRPNPNSHITGIKTSAK